MVDRVNVKTHLILLGWIEEKYKSFFESFKKIDKVVVNKMYQRDLELFIRALKKYDINYDIKIADENIEFAISADDKQGFVKYGCFKTADTPKVVWV